MRLSYRWQATLVIALGLLMAILDTTIVSVVLPQMAVAFHTDYQTITWVGTGYFLANAAIVPIVGYLSDRIGSKNMFLIALCAFTIGSALCAIAPNEQFLIACRVLQGIGGGALIPVAMATIFRLFGPTERAGALAMLMIPLLLGPAFGPTLGGYLATNFSWNAIFTINLPIGVAAFLLTLLVLRGKKAERELTGRSDEPEPRGFDLFGLLFSMAGFTAFVYGITQAGAKGWGDATVISFMVIGGALLIAFIVVELIVKDPVMDVRLFRSYTFTVANILIWATTAVFFGSLFLIPLFFEKIENLSALTTGEIVISQGLAMAVGLALSGKLYNKVGPRILAALGALSATIALFGFTRLSVTTTGTDLQVWLVLSGLGLGLIGQPLQTLAASVVSNRQMAKASSLMSSFKTASGALGVAILTTYLTQRTTSHVKEAATSCVQFAGAHLQVFQACVAQHAATLGMNDTYLFALIGCAICTVAALFVGRDPAIEAAKAAKKQGEIIETAPAPMLGD